MGNEGTPRYMQGLHHSPYQETMGGGIGGGLLLPETCLWGWTRWTGPSCLPSPASLNSGLTHLYFWRHFHHLLSTGPLYEDLKQELLSPLQSGGLFPEELSLGLLPLLHAPHSDSLLLSDSAYPFGPASLLWLSVSSLTVPRPYLTPL